MKPKIKRDIQRRGELVGAFIRNGCKTEGVGTGVSSIAQLIEFKGDIPRASGQDKSSLASIISLENYQRTDEPVIFETISALSDCAEISHRPALVWLYHYAVDGTQVEKSRHLSMPRSRYQELLNVGEGMLAARLLEGLACRQH